MRLVLRVGPLYLKRVERGIERQVLDMILDPLTLIKVEMSKSQLTFKPQKYLESEGLNLKIDDEDS